MSSRRTTAVLFVVCILTAGARGGLAADGPVARRIGAASAGNHTGAVLVYAEDQRQLLSIAPTLEERAAPAVQAFDLAARTWRTLSTARPATKQFHPYYQAAYDPGSQTVFCLSGGNVLHAFHVAEQKWESLPPAPELDGLGWRTLACDTRGHRLVVVGADKRVDNLGWCRTLVYDIGTGKWTRLDVTDAKVRAAHQQLVQLKEAVIDLSGRIRLSWFRDPQGVGTAVERKELLARAQATQKLTSAEPFADGFGRVLAALEQQQLLTSLQAARDLQRAVEEAAEAQFPVPCARRNSPLAFDSRNNVFVLFGGDHEDYLLNDTWVLNLEQGTWQRQQPPVAPSPRAGHVLISLPQRGGVVLYEGYLQSNNTDYSARPYDTVSPVELWRYDPQAVRWGLLAQWPLPKKDQQDKLPPVGHFYGYASEYYSPPTVVADAQDRLLFDAHPGSEWYLRWKDFPSATWLLEPNWTQPDTEAQATLGRAPNQRLSRQGAFTAAYCEVADPPPETGLNQLPDNQWVRLPDSPRNPCRGCRQRDWGTAVWDSDRQQVLLWGGGHCVRSASVVAHYSPASGRIVEGYDADEPYGANGSGGYDSSLLNRPWVGTHNYNHYAYDPKCRLLVSGRGYLYDPDRMDWLRLEPIALPYAFSWGHTVVETSCHGAVAWAQKPGSDDFGLWLFDRQQGWIDLEPQGKLFGPYCDAHGMVYDSRRDRMILGGVGGGYQKQSDGTLLAFDFATHKLVPVTPDNATYAKTRNARELAYVEHADWVLFGDLYRQGDERTGKVYTRVYDCAKNKMFLLDAGVPGDARDLHGISYSTGWMYDAQRRLVYVFSVRGEAWAMKVNVQTAQLSEEPR